MSVSHPPARSLLVCPECRAERDFEQPPCHDEHGADCPERCCVDCGAALLAGPAGVPARQRVAAAPAA